MPALCQRRGRQRAWRAFETISSGGGYVIKNSLSLSLSLSERFKQQKNSWIPISERLRAIDKIRKRGSGASQGYSERGRAESFG